MIEVMGAMIQDSMNEIHTSLPAVIKSINYQKGTCTVQIIPRRVLCGKLVSYPPLIDVKLDFLKFGTWKFQIPRKIGDKVWVGFSEVTLSEETSLERFSLNEPYIIGSCEEGYEGNSEDIILTGKGTKIEIKGDGSISITTGANRMIINSDISVNGNMNIEGEIIASVDVVGAGVSLKDHTHKYNPGGSPLVDTKKPS